MSISICLLSRILLEYEAMPIVEMPSDEGNSVSVDHVIPAPTKLKPINIPNLTTASSIKSASDYFNE